MILIFSQGHKPAKVQSRSQGPRKLRIAQAFSWTVEAKQIYIVADYVRKMTVIMGVCPEDDCK